MHERGFKHNPLNEAVNLPIQFIDALSMCFLFEIPFYYAKLIKLSLCYYLYIKKM
jgi:hypothetical protein